MDNKQLGIGMVVISLLLALVLLSFKIQLTKTSEAGCGCAAGSCPMQETLPLTTYGGIALIFAIFSLGVYLVFFEKSQKEIISTLEKQKKIQTEDEKFEILTKAMDEYEKKVLTAIREQNGITQSTLVFRTDLSKSKISSILTDFEKKGLIKRVPKGKTMEIYLK